MSKPAITRQLRRLDNEYREVGDGGYTLLAVVRDYSSQLDREEQNSLKVILLDMVRDQDKTLFGVALEALVQDWGSEISGKLHQIVEEEQLEMEWESDILLALLRLGYIPIEGRALKHISQRLLADDLTVFSLVAALAHISKEQCLSVASLAIANEIARSNSDNLEGYLPAFVRNFMEVDKAMLLTLVVAVSKQDRVAGRVLANMLLDYLDRGYVQDELGAQSISELRKSLIKVI